MAIGAQHIVQMSSRVLSGGSDDLESNGMVLSKSALIPTNQPAMLFSNAADVSSLFGAESDEAAFAQQYFMGVENQQAAVKTLVIGRRIDQACAAYIRGGKLLNDLAGLKTITDGAMKITVDGTEKTVTNCDLSEATSLSDVAETVATAITGVTGAYDSNTNTFTFTSSTTGAESTISYASASGSGTDLAEALSLRQEDGAVLSDGSAALDEISNLDAICNVTRNWVGFTTLWETELAEAEENAFWTDSTGDDFVYFDWTLDQNALDQLTQATSKPAQMMDKYNCTATIYGNALDAAFCLAVGASIAWNRTQGMKVWFAKSATGITPLITEEAPANALEAIRCNYSGEFATRNARFSFFNRGTLTSDFYGFIDTLYGSIYLRNALQRSCMDGFKRTNRTPYNARGEALIRSWCQDPINRCLDNGVIDAGLEINESQRQQLLNEFGDESLLNDLFSKGYFVTISLPDANARASREAPTVSVVYAYAGSVQRLEVAVTTVI